MKLTLSSAGNYAVVVTSDSKTFVARTLSTLFKVFSDAMLDVAKL